MSAKNEQRKLRHALEKLQLRAWAGWWRDLRSEQEKAADAADAEFRRRVEAAHAAVGERVRWDDGNVL